LREYSFSELVENLENCWLIKHIDAMDEEKLHHFMIHASKREAAAKWRRTTDLP